MNIVYAADNNFVDILYASIKSLYNANHDFKINLWIIADNVSDENKNKIIRVIIFFSFLYLVAF